MPPKFQGKCSSTWSSTLSHCSEATQSEVSKTCAVHPHELLHPLEGGLYTSLSDWSKKALQTVRSRKRKDSGWGDRRPLCSRQARRQKAPRRISSRRYNWKDLWGVPVYWEEIYPTKGESSIELLSARKKIRRKCACKHMSHRPTIFNFKQDQS